jgi:hypothetical protein
MTETPHRFAFRLTSRDQSNIATLQADFVARNIAAHPSQADIVRHALAATVARLSPLKVGAR